MRNPNWKSSAAFCVALAVAFATSSCDDRSTSATCVTTISGYASPATGVLTLQGQFYANESVLVRDAQSGALVASGTPASNRTSFTFTGIPSGTHGYDIVASCSGGQETVNTGVYDIK